MEHFAPPENSGGDGTASCNRENGFAYQVIREDVRVKIEEGDGNLVGNRWPREETLALLKIRTDMDAAFRDSGHRTRLWDEVSRKLSELGYKRSAKKCKEKFENIYKYHRRTRECRSGRPNCKRYQFSKQLEALNNQHLSLSSHVYAPNNLLTPINFTKCHFDHDAVPYSTYKPLSIHLDASTSTSCSSRDESDGTPKKKKKKKRELTEFFGRLVKEVVAKQEKLQKEFMETLEKLEQDRATREEAWKMQEIERINRERELLVQERSIAAAKDAAVLAFLQKLSEQANTVGMPQIEMGKKIERQVNGYNVCESYSHSGSSRWPKEEIEALISVRSNLYLHHQENGSKGSLWDEISAEMKRLGYDRSAKRCKEKWENMNKYFKKVKEGNKRRRSEDSKTCPYFEYLDTMYREKTPKFELKPEGVLMHMSVQEEQRPQKPVSFTERGSANFGRNLEEHGHNGVWT